MQVSQTLQRDGVTVTVSQRQLDAAHVVFRLVWEMEKREAEYRYDANELTVNGLAVRVSGGAGPLPFAWTRIGGTASRSWSGPRGTAQLDIPVVVGPTVQAQRFTVGALEFDPAGFGRSGQLWAAAAAGSVDAVKTLLDQGADRNVGNAADQNKTALHVAVEKGHLDVVRQLGAVGANVNAALEGVTVAIREGGLPVGGMAALNRAARSRPGGTTPLMLAVSSGSLPSAEAVLGLKPNLNAHDSRGMTALMIAAESGRLDLTTALLNAGADIDAPGPDGATALAFALMKQAPDVANALLAAGASAEGPAGEQAVAIAILHGDLAMVRGLMARGANVHAAASGIPFIAVAAAKGHLDVLEELLKAGTDVNVRTSDGETALMLAARSHAALLPVLLGAKADLLAADASGRTPLLHAASAGNTEAITLLLGAGANLRDADELGRTALSQASAAGHDAAVRALIAARAELDAGDNGGLTPLMHAAQAGHLPTVQLLVEAGANVSAKSRLGRTAEWLADRAKHKSIVDYLKRAPKRR